MHAREVERIALVAVLARDGLVLARAVPLAVRPVVVADIATTLAGGAVLVDYVARRAPAAVYTAAVRCGAGSREPGDMIANQQLGAGTAGAAQRDLQSFGRHSVHVVYWPHSSTAIVLRF
jgi:hypothetical protein